MRDGQKYGALGMLNTTWDDDGEALFAMTWPAIVFGAACSWQEGEAGIENFKSKYDWAFYRNTDNTFRDAIQSLTRAHSILRAAGAGEANDEAFWTNPFSEVGASYIEKAAARQRMSGSKRNARLLRFIAIERKRKRMSTR